MSVTAGGESLMEPMKSAYVINTRDNVAVALEVIDKGEKVPVIGESALGEIEAADAIPKGHKIALSDIAGGAPIVKYGIVIGRATAQIKKGSWVHLHNMASNYDERSSAMDARTGAPKDTIYE